MRKPFLFTALILGVLLFAPPVFAVSYSGSVLLDLSTLTFSGIPVSLSQIIPRDPFDPSRGNIEAETRHTFLFEHAPNAVRLSHDILSPTWVDGAVTEHLAGVGMVTALASPTELSSSINLLTSASASSMMVRDGLLTATQAGSLTISINYALSHSGGLVGDPDFGSTGRAALTVGRFEDVNQQRDFRDFRVGNVTPFDDPRDQRGTLSATYLFNAGQSTIFEVFTVVNGNVPIPAMFWPTVLGMVGLAGLVAWRQRRERLS